MTAQPHPSVRAEWLALAPEEAIEPERPIIDAHHHLWSKNDDRYLADDLLEDAASGHRIVATVFVEGNTAHRETGPRAFAPVGETEMAQRERAHAKSRGRRIVDAVVARADLMLGHDVGAVLDAHTVAAKGAFRGVRHATPWHADPAARGSAILSPPGMLYDASFRDGLDELRKRDLVFDAWMYHTQLGDLVDLANDMPDLRIVLDHVGGPIGIGPYAGRRSEVFEDWSHWIRRLASCPNLSVKLSGLGMRMFGFGFSDRPVPPSSRELAMAWRPYIQTCIEAFGPERAMFASNFPVDKGTASYVVLWNAFKQITSGASAEELEALFFQTATRAYSLDTTLPQ